MFQIPDAAGDPITRWAALFSLIFSIMSLTYGCIYIVQFGTMRSMYKASRWAEVSSYVDGLNIGVRLPGENHRDVTHANEEVHDDGRCQHSRPTTRRDLSQLAYDLG